MAVVPVFGLILFGYGVRRFDFPGPGFWPLSEKLTYYVLLPALLVRGLSGREFQADAWPLVCGLILAVLLVGALLSLLRRSSGMDGPAFTSVFQGAIRPNTYVGLSVAVALLGPDWMGLSAVALLTLVPLVNILCVVSLSRHGNNGANGPAHVVVELFRNPLILACIVGLIMNGLSWSLPAVADALLGILGRAALPMGLLAVGAGLRVKGATQGMFAIMTSSAAHLLLLPAVTAVLGRLLGASQMQTLAMIIYTAIPVSVSSFILARQMGGDHDLMARIITIQTLLSVVTLPCMILLLG